MRLVVDTSVWIRALLTSGPARAFLRIAPLTHELLYHDEQLIELQDVAVRPRVDIPRAALDELIDRVTMYGTRVECLLDSIADCRDPKDNYILAIAEAGHADAIISEDSDLLVLDPWRGVRVLRLFQFLEKVPFA